MLLGLVTDIHNDAERLANALRLFEDAGVEQVINVGDACDAFADRRGTEAVARLLRDADAIGVWGNHDFGLCRDVPEATANRTPAVTLRVMATMQPFLRVEDCYISHRHSAIDANDPVQLWSLSPEARDDLIGLANEAFDAVPDRVQFLGHYHRFWGATPAGPLKWDSASVLELGTEERAVVILGPVFGGYCATYETADGELIPLVCDA